MALQDGGINIQSTTFESPPIYQHTQRGPWSFVLLAITAVNLTLAARLWGNDLHGQLAPFGVALLMTFLAFCCQSLTTTVSETSLRFIWANSSTGKKVALGQVVSVQKKAACSMAGACIGHWAGLDLQHVGFRLPFHPSWDIAVPSGNQRSGSTRSFGKSHWHSDRKR